MSIKIKQINFTINIKNIKNKINYNSLIDNFALRKIQYFLIKFTVIVKILLLSKYKSSCFEVCLDLFTIGPTLNSVLPTFFESFFRV